MFQLREAENESINLTAVLCEPQTEREESVVQPEKLQKEKNKVRLQIAAAFYMTLSCVTTQTAEIVELSIFCL